MERRGGAGREIQPPAGVTVLPVWQLHQRWQQVHHDEARKTERIRLESFRLRRLLILLIIIASGALGASLGSRFTHPLNYVIVALWAIGGMALAVLFVMIPRQAWRVLRRAAIGLAIWRRRRALNRLVRLERHTLTREAEEAPSGTVLSDLALAEYLRGHLSTAQTHLAHALELDPRNHDLLNNLGVVLARQGEADRAAELFVRAMGEGADAPARANCALVAPLVKAPEELAAMITETGLALDAALLNNIGVALAAGDEWESATEWIRRAVSTDGDLAPARANLGLLVYRRGDLQEAANEIMQASRHDPSEPAFGNYLGVILTAAGQTDQARAYLRRAHKAAPADVPTLINTTAADAAAGHWRVARRGFRSLLGVDSHRGDAAYNLAVCELAIQDPAKAADAAAVAIEAGDTGPDAYTVLAVALWETGRRAEALSHFQSAVLARGAGPAAFSNFGRAMLLSDDTQGAVAVLAQAVQRWPNDLHTTFDQATARLADAAHRFAPALSLLERQSLLAPAQRSHAGLAQGLERPDLAAEANVNLGLYHYMHEQYERAAEYFEAAARLVPRCRELSFLIGTTLAEDGERQIQRTGGGDIALTLGGRESVRRAVAHLEAACESRDLLYRASRNLGRCYYLLQDYEHALAAFRRAIRAQAQPELHSMAALAAARQAHQLQLTYRAGMLSDSRRDQLRHQAMDLLDISVHYFRQALLHDEMDPALHGNLGIAYMLRNRDNDVEAALRHWERMRVIGRGAMDGRYAELAQLENLVDSSRVGLDDRGMKTLGLAPARWLAVPPPRPTPIRFVLEPVPVRHEWRLTAFSPHLQQAFRLSHSIASAQEWLRRLRV